VVIQYTVNVTTDNSTRELPYITSCAGGRHNMPPPLQVDL